MLVLSSTRTDITGRSWPIAACRERCKANAESRGCPMLAEILREFAF